MDDKSINLSLNPSLFGIAERIAKIYNQSIEEYIRDSIKYSIQCDISINYSTINKCIKNLKQELEEAGIEVNFE